MEFAENVFIHLIQITEKNATNKFKSEPDFGHNTSLKKCMS